MITTGILGSTWRASITPWGAVRPWDGSAELGWHLAADDRWYSPEFEPTVRQRRVDDSAVVETRMRIPHGDVVHTVYTVADAGGLTVVEVTNESPLPVVVAFTRGDVLTARPPTTPVAGPDLPSGAIALPVGHRASATVAVAHRSGVRALPSRLPQSADVAHGWTTVVGAAGRFVVPDEARSAGSVAARCELLLSGPPAIDDPVGLLLGVGLLVRMGGDASQWVDDVAVAVEAAARHAPRTWDLAAAIDAAERVLAAADEHRAVDDLQRVRAAVGAPDAPPVDPPADAVRSAVWLERRFVGVGGALLPFGFPASWGRSNFEVFELPSSATSQVSYAVRWHGDRPAVLWEQHGSAIVLSAPVAAPGWTTSEVRGEALWPAP